MHMYERLFSTGRIGRIEIKNRVVMTPMGTVIAAPGGGVNDDIIAYYEARAKGGVGLIESELCRVLNGAGAAMTCQLAARNLADVAGLARSLMSCTSTAQDIHPAPPPRRLGSLPSAAAHSRRIGSQSPAAYETPHSGREIAKIESLHLRCIVLRWQLTASCCMVRTAI